MAKSIEISVSHFHIQTLTDTKEKPISFPSHKCFMHFNPSKRKSQTYIGPVSKSSIERLFTGSKQVLDIIQTFNFEFLRLLFYDFPKRENEQSNSKSWPSSGYSPSPIYLIFVFSLFPVLSVASYTDTGKYFSKDDARNNKRIKTTLTVKIGE